MTTISVITPTFRREDLLARCVESVLAQQVGADVEHIVVNDAGEPLRHAAWMDDPRVTVVNTYRTERCVARNTGAALSRGQWLYFLDDDDYALPGAFEAMLEVAQQTSAAHVYGGYRIVSEATGQATDIRPALRGDIFPLLVAGESIPPQATWLRREAFFAAGGFDPAFIAAEDADLVRRIGGSGTIAGTPCLVAVVRVDHPATTTSKYARHMEYWFRGIEKCLDMPNTFAHIRSRTHGAPYWRGRCVREYVASGVRNVRSRRPVRALSRLGAGVRLGLPCLLSPQFYPGVRRRGEAAAPLDQGV